MWCKPTVGFCWYPPTKGYPPRSTSSAGAAKLARVSQIVWHCCADGQLRVIKVPTRNWTMQMSLKTYWIMQANAPPLKTKHKKNPWAKTSAARMPNHSIDAALKKARKSSLLVTKGAYANCLANFSSLQHEICVSLHIMLWQPRSLVLSVSLECIGMVLPCPC